MRILVSKRDSEIFGRPNTNCGIEPQHSRYGHRDRSEGAEKGVPRVEHDLPALRGGKFVGYGPNSSSVWWARFASSAAIIVGTVIADRSRDETLHIAAVLTLAAQEVTALLGIQEFRERGQANAAEAERFAAERIDGATRDRAAGETRRLLHQGAVFGDQQVWDWNRDFVRKTCGYVSFPYEVLMQGPNGGKTDGRMVTWDGLVQPRSPDEDTLAKPCDGSRYLAGLYTLEELGEQLRRQAAQVGMDRAEQWIALSDGGMGLENFFDVNFPGAVKVLDFHHATGHLTTLAKMLRPGIAGDKLLEAWCHTLKHAGGGRLLAVLEKLDRRKMTEETRSEHDQVLTYFRNHVGRMNYPEYLRRGWQIGSGSIESACKRVVNQRLCQGGMRWGEEGSDAVAHLRALCRSDADQWESFWSLAA